MANGGTVEYFASNDYDTADRLWHVYENHATSPAATYSWDANGNRSQLDYDQINVQTYNNYNAGNQLTSITSAGVNWSATAVSITPSTRTGINWRSLPGTRGGLIHMIGRMS